MCTNQIIEKLQENINNTYSKYTEFFRIYYTEEKTFGMYHKSHSIRLFIFEWRQSRVLRIKS